jgi:AraC family transcriptional regulator of adaptative response/methylated-DNA-[protein]-cysteine methyltransferase
MALPQSAPFAGAESRWAALTARDVAADGAFVYAVRTTGVYCRPGCASRLPKRVNVEFFDHGEAAARAGYRPCKRCRPDAVSPGQSHAAIIARACARLDQAEDPPTLAVLAADAGLSPWHFQRLFKAALGVTPKQFAARRRLERLRARLRHSPTVTGAIFDAGFGSSARAYHDVDAGLGMTPTRYRQGGAGMTIDYAFARCFLGWAIIAATERGLCAVEFGDDRIDLLGQLTRHFPKARIEKAAKEFSDVVENVVALIDAPRAAADLALDIQGTAFQQQVWCALRAIKPGQTASYSEIARRLGRPKAVRAVAGACAANTLGVVIPCHRVLRSDGGLGGYRWGVTRKRALLEREAGGATPPKTGRRAT